MNLVSISEQEYDTLPRATALAEIEKDFFRSCSDHSI